MPTAIVYPDAHLTGAWQQTTPTPTEASLWESVDAEDDTSYIGFLEPVFTSGNCYEVLEFDLGSLPAGAVITSLAIEYRHSKNRAGGIRVSSCAIDESGGIVEGEQETTQYGKWNDFHNISHAARFALRNGALWSEFDRVGAVLQHTNGESSGSGYHRLYYVRAVIEYDVDAVPSATVTAPTGTLAAMPAVAWTYSHGDGQIQTHFQVKVTDQAVTDPDSATPALDSGKTQSNNARSWASPDPLAAGDYKAWVRVWSTTSSGAPTQSGWVSSSFTISVPADPAEAPLGLWLDYMPDEASVRVEVEPAVLNETGRFAIERSASGSDWENIGAVELEAREAALLRFDAGALAYVSAPGVFEEFDYGLFRLGGRIRRVHGRTQMIACLKTWGTAVERGAAVAARADSFYDMRYRDGSGNLPCRNGSGRLATRVGGTLLDHDGTDYVRFPEVSGNYLQHADLALDASVLVLTYHFIDGVVAQAATFGCPGGVFSGGTTAGAMLYVAANGSVRAFVGDNDGGSVDTGSTSSIPAASTRFVRVIAEEGVGAAIELSDDGVVWNPYRSVANTSLGRISGTSKYAIGGIPYGPTVNPAAGSLASLTIEEDGVRNAASFDASDLAGWSVFRSESGEKLAIVTAPVDLFDGDSSYWRLDPLDTPTFGQIDGQDTRVVQFAGHPALADYQRVFSAEGSTNQGLMIAFDTASQVTTYIDGRSANDSNISADDGLKHTFASVVDNGVFADYSDSQGLRGPRTIPDEVGPMAAPIVGASAVAAGGGSASTIECFANLNYGDLALTEQELDDLNAFLQADRRVSPFAPATYLAILPDGRLEGSFELQDGSTVRGRSTSVAIDADRDGLPVWAQMDFYPNSGQYAAFAAHTDEGTYRHEDVVWSYFGDDTPSAATVNTAASVGNDVVIGPATDPGADLDVFYVIQHQNVNSTETDNNLDIESSLDEQPEELASVTSAGGSVWTFSDPYDAGDPPHNIEPVVTEPVVFTDYPPLHKTLVYRARNAPADGSPASAYVNSAAIDSFSDRWWMIDPEDHSLDCNPDVVSPDWSDARRSLSTRQKGRTVVATSGSLGDDMTLTVRCLDAGEREAVEALLGTGRSFRLVDTLGRERTVAVSGSVGYDWVRAMPVGDDNKVLRDFHVLTIPLIEVV